MTNEKLNISILERQILHCWIDNPNLTFEDDIFISENAKEFQYVLLSLKDDDLEFIPEHMITKSIEFVDGDAIKSVLDTNYQLDKYESYKEELCRKSIIHKFKDEIVYTLDNNKLNDEEKLREIEKYFDECKNYSKNSEGLSFYDMIQNHKKVIEKRANGLSVTTGCYMLDKILPNPSSGLITICGYSGSCKSTFVQYLVKQRIAKRLPTVLINTELSEEGLMDSLTSSMIQENYNDIRGVNNDDEHIDFADILTKYDSLSELYKNNKYFKYYPKSNISISEFESFMIKVKKEFNLSNNDLPIFVFIDLMSMMKDFCEGVGNRADVITQALNKLNAVALKYNLIIVGTVQLKRLQNKVTIEKEEDIDKFRPTLESIKDSGSYEERSRVILSIHNPYHIVHKNPCNQLIKDLTEPLIEIRVLKNSYNDVVGDYIKYYMNSKFKVFVPYEETNLESEVENSGDENGEN